MGDIPSMEIVQLARRPTHRMAIEFRVLDDLSSIVVDVESGEAHALTPTATAIFERCDGATTVDEIVAEIVEIFDCARDRAERDVVAFLDDLVARRLVGW